jgi:hypothetical protein
MDCATQSHAAPMGLGNILMDIVGYKHATPTGFGISRRVRRKMPLLHHAIHTGRSDCAWVCDHLAPARNQ